ncbi:hypothetical protein N5079_22210 [Planotetraspora sp. A-T 1434]|uniref:hypothetical protein n=1 Tax=Planotetraspora sp. A-T 1434 TaxID=2979219 RepID=UPI0021BE96EA|nr:hypothetical protein [Planotetraspora sp. A-T 1434]MCT9932925.1 hypothetical protein [Planotetraspora sp. A-T 1434]
MNDRRDAIFDEPDIPEDFDQAEVEIATSYNATATRTGKHWTATVRNLPEGHVIQVQGATWRETKDNVLNCVVDLLHPAPGTVGIHLAPADPEAADALNSVIDARVARFYAEQAERDAVRKAARTLIDQGWTTRDIGSALGLSHQRISQIVPRATM